MESVFHSARFRAEDRGVIERIASMEAIEDCHLRLLGRKLIVDRYFDSFDWRLFTKGCTYRERRIGGRRWVAFRGSPELVRRVSDPVDAELPIGVKLDDISRPLEPMVRAWETADRLPLGQILVCENNRTLIELVEEGEPRFLLCLDDIEFFSNGTQRRWCEVKLDMRRDPNESMMWLISLLKSRFSLVTVSGPRLPLGLSLTGAQPRAEAPDVSPADVHAALRSILAS